MEHFPMFRRRRVVGLVHIREAIHGFFEQFNASVGAVDPDPDYWPMVESPIEDRFERCIWNSLIPQSRLQRQVEVDTICGRFRLDFVLSDGSRRIAVECDGRDYHDRVRDEVRDALILDSGEVAAIYRIPGTAIHRRIDDALFLLACWERCLFPDSALAEMEIRASDAVKRTGWCNRDFGGAEYLQRHDNGFISYERISITRHAGDYGLNFVQAARDKGCTRLDDLLVLLGFAVPQDAEGTG